MNNYNENVILIETRDGQKTVFSPHAKNSEELIKEFTNALMYNKMDRAEKGEDN